jgi:hypothetical protein
MVSLGAWIQLPWAKDLFGSFVVDRVCGELVDGQLAHSADAFAGCKVGVGHQSRLLLPMGL